MNRSAQLQSSILQSEILFTGWLLKPQVNYNRHYVYYATTSSWDGEQVLHIKASSFHQLGYLIFRITSQQNIKNISAEHIQLLINQTLDSYYHKKDLAQAH